MNKTLQKCLNSPVIKNGCVGFIDEDKEFAVKRCDASDEVDGDDDTGYGATISSP